MKGTHWRNFDFWLVGATTVMIILGVAMINSAIAGNIELTTETPLVSRQIIFALIGYVVMITVASIDYRVWDSLSTQLYVGMAIALISLNLIGGALFGSARWFQTALVFIQPSEFAKLVMILSMGSFFSRHMHEMTNPRWTFVSALLMMGLTIWVLLQPNLSTSIVLVVLWFVLLWMAGIPVRHLFFYAAAGVLTLAITFPIAVEIGLIQQYQLQRVINFVAPDPNARYGETYNLLQAQIAIGSGEMFGMGYGHGPQVQLRFLKVRWSDFIFSTISHELGFAGAMAVIGLVTFIVYRCLWAARASRDAYGSLICYGVATLLAFQAFVNLGVNLQLMPATGLTLPFVSYGGSSLLANMIAIGLVESVIMRRKASEV